MQDPIITIRTLECDECKRFDSIMLTAAEIKARIAANSVDVAAYSISHNDHTRIVYFDNTGLYLGDTIAFPEDELPDIAKTESIPFYILNQHTSNIFQRLRQMILNKIHSKNLSITITGPSRAGKTSLVRYLQTLLPERERGTMRSVPTMGKSTQRLELGSSSLLVMDMGGQKDFWDLWEDPIGSSGMIIFIFDATSNNLLEIAQAFERVVEYRSEHVPIFVILNKKDLVLRGQAKTFSNTGEFLALTKLNLPLPNIKAVEASIFEGKAYINQEEIPLAEVISSFIDEFC